MLSIQRETADYSRLVGLTLRPISDPMDSTSASLLRRVQSDDPAAAWEQLVDLYAPLIYHWGKQQGLSSTDASELLQEVLTTLVTKLPEFRYDPKRRFRGWLRTIAINKATDLKRRNHIRPISGQDETLACISVASEVDLWDESEYRSYLVSHAMKLMRAQFPERHWDACWMMVAEGRSAKQVAQELGMTENAVYVAKSRLMKRLREELDGLVD